MPKSKRDRGPATMKDLALTKTEKKGRQIKNGLIQQIRDAVDRHDAMYMFTFENLRSTHMKVRAVRAVVSAAGSAAIRTNSV
jgi:mRNA turnover protein 4